MHIQIISILLLLVLCYPSKMQQYNPHLHKGLNLMDVSILSPPSCSQTSNVDMLYMVHTAPDHGEQRSILRKSWTSNRIGFNNTRTIFVIGKSNNALTAMIEQEHHEFNDIFMYNRVDTYRNMTIKVNIY